MPGKPPRGRSLDLSPEERHRNRRWVALLALLIVGTLIGVAVIALLAQAALGHSPAHWIQFGPTISTGSGTLSAGQAWLDYLQATRAWNEAPTEENRARIADAVRRLSRALGGSEEDAIAAAAQLEQTLAREANQKHARAA